MAPLYEMKREKASIDCRLLSAMGPAYRAPQSLQGKRREESWNLTNSLSLRASAHTGVAISRLGVQFLVDEFRKMAQKKGRLYDDGLPGIRWRLPHQRARWFAMTRSNGPTNSNFSVSHGKRGAGFSFRFTNSAVSAGCVLDRGQEM